MDICFREWWVTSPKKKRRFIDEAFEVDLRLGDFGLLKRLEPCQRILLAGAGGGYDIFAGLPLFHCLREQGKDVYLASLSFSELKMAQGRWLGDEILEVLPGAGGEESYFPERYLSEWLSQGGTRVPVYCYRGVGAQVMLDNFERLVAHLDLDALVLVDGGTDSLMRGDEPGLGSPAEDVVSLAAADRLELPVRILLNLGFGVDHFHGVCHKFVLEAIADLTKAGAFLGAQALLPNQPEFDFFKSGLEYVQARMPGKESIVATSIVAAGEGHFGNHHPTARTEGSELFINPLMAIYWAFELEGVARRCLYLDYIYDTYSKWDVHRAITNYLHVANSRPWEDIPL